MSDLKQQGFKAGDVLSSLSSAFEGMSEAERKDQIRKTNGIFQLNVTNGSKDECTWIIDLKKEGTVTKGAGKKADVTINMSDDTFQQISDGKLTGQKAFMSGTIKVKGNIMMATKLDGVLRSAKSKL